jgi:hypothetical protein
MPQQVEDAYLLVGLRVAHRFVLQQHTPQIVRSGKGLGYQWPVKKHTYCDKNYCFLHCSKI